MGNTERKAKQQLGLVGVLKGSDICNRGIGYPTPMCSMTVMAVLSECIASRLREHHLSTPSSTVRVKEISTFQDHKPNSPGIAS